MIRLQLLQRRRKLLAYEIRLSADSVVWWATDAELGREEDVGAPLASRVEGEPFPDDVLAVSLCGGYGGIMEE